MIFYHEKKLALILRQFLPLIDLNDAQSRTQPILFSNNSDYLHDYLGLDFYDLTGGTIIVVNKGDGEYELTYASDNTTYKIDYAGTPSYSDEQ